MKEVEPLNYYPDSINNIDWYTKDGYYITSTIYLFSSLACWISIYQRDVAFLDFGKNSISADFIRKIEELKQSISDTEKGSIMWYYYFNSIGEILIGSTQNLPITFAQFIKNIDTDVKFKLFISQAFYFINTLSDKKSVDLINQIIQKINSCKRIIENNIDIPQL